MRVQSWKCGADGTPIGTACGDPVFLAALSKTITEAFRSESFNPMAGTAPARSHPGSNSRSPEGFVEYRLSRHRCCGPRIHHYPCRLLTLLEQETREGEAAAKRKAHTAIIRRPKNQKEGVAPSFWLVQLCQCYFFFSAAFFLGAGAFSCRRVMASVALNG